MCNHSAAAEKVMATGKLIGESAKDLAADFSTAAINAGLYSASRIYAYKYHQLVIITGYIRVNNSDLPVNTVIASVSGISAPREVFVSSASDNNNLLRLKMTVSGNIMTEGTIVKNNWYSFSFITYTSI